MNKGDMRIKWKVSSIQNGAEMKKNLDFESHVKTDVSRWHTKNNIFTTLKSTQTYSLMAINIFQ